MIPNVASLAQVLADNSRVHEQFIYKTTHADGSSGDGVDMSMAAGTPKYNAYVGDQGRFTPMSGAGNFGIYTGASETGRSKYLARLALQTMSANNVGTFILADYLGFYALVDLDDTAEQVLENDQVPTRYADGAGVRMMFVTTTPSTGTANITVSYTNQNGVAGRIATSSLGTGLAAGSIVTAPVGTFTANMRGPWLGLADGDTGVRSVQSVTLNQSMGGFGALVLVKPIEQINLIESPTVAEITPLVHRGRIPKIADDAYLNFIFRASGSITPAVLAGSLTIVRM